MHRFVFFVDGSNLLGSLRGIGIQVDDYEAFYRYIFEQAVAQWRDTFEAVTPAGAQLFRIYWYALGEIDRWDLANPKAQIHLKERFEADRDLKRTYMALAGQEMGGSGASQDEVFKEAWAMCFKEFKDWYESRVDSVDGMKRFYHAVRSSTDYIDIIECGHWKVDFLKHSLSEKGLDTTLAVDMVDKLDEYDVAIVVSGDADSIPSISIAKSRGKHVAAVEFIPGFPPAERGRGFSSSLKVASDFVVRIYEMDLIQKELAKKREYDDSSGT